MAALFGGMLIGGLIVYYLLPKRTVVCPGNHHSFLSIQDEGDAIFLRIMVSVRPTPNGKRIEYILNRMYDESPRFLKEYNDRFNNDSKFSTAQED